MTDLTILVSSSPEPNFIRRHCASFLVRVPVQSTWVEACLGFPRLVDPLPTPRGTCWSPVGQGLSEAFVTGRVPVQACRVYLKTSLPGREPVCARWTPRPAVRRCRVWLLAVCQCRVWLLAVCQCRVWFLEDSSLRQAVRLCRLAVCLKHYLLRP